MAISSSLLHDIKFLRDSIPLFPEPVAHPVLVVVSGLPGSGKTYFSQRLASDHTFLVLESDVLRRTLFNKPDHSAEESSRLFLAVYELIREFLSKSIPLIFDATNLLERHRDVLYNITDQLNARLILVWVEAPQDIIHSRLKKRERATDVNGKSEAGWAVYKKMKRDAQKISRRHYTVDTSRDISPVIGKILREISRR